LEINFEAHFLRQKKFKFRLKMDYFICPYLFGTYKFA
jgi:hypothetical protein